MMVSKFFSLALITLLSIQLPAFAEEVNVYSSRKEALIKPLLDRFTEQTGIKVNLITGADDALISRLSLEGSKSPADLLVTADAGRLHRAKVAQLLQPLESDFITQRVPEHLIDVDQQWVGLTLRARPIFYAKDRVDPSLITSYSDLTDEQWSRRICVRSSDNIYNQSLMASMIASEGEANALAFAQGLVANFARPPAGADTDQLKAAAAGVCDIAIANTYYFGRLLISDKAIDQKIAQRLGVIWPNQDDRGTHVNVSGIALTKSAKNKAQAIRLIEFMLTDESQTWYSEVNSEYPVVQGIEASEALKSLGDFKADALNLSVLGVNNAAAVQLMDKAGWR
ncbi:Fe(3+) ABC transporter substrate-binding protein [Reinekea thalattae]|nr:Fe(3+) ABC transporter substrate-binding protein [Reinekea thalattae]